MSKLAKKLTSLREQKGISQYKIAEELNIKRSAYGNYETGMSYPEYSVLEILAEYYDMKIEDLLRVDEGFEKKLNIKEEAKELKQHIKEYYYRKYREIPSEEVLRKIINLIK